MPMRLISFSKSQRASYSRNPVGFTRGKDSYSKVFGERAVCGLGNMVHPDRRVVGAERLGYRDERRVTTLPIAMRREQGAACLGHHGTPRSCRMRANPAKSAALGDLVLVSIPRRASASS